MRGKQTIWTTLEKEKRNKNEVQSEVARKELEKIDLRKELKRKERALAAEEEELVKARTEITKFRTAHINQMDQVSNLQIQNNDKDVKIRVLEEENE